MSTHFNDDSLDFRLLITSQHCSTDEQLFILTPNQNNLELKKKVKSDQVLVCLLCAGSGSSE